MVCCNHCIDAGNFFSRRLAQRELRGYRKSGPRGTTRLLLRAIGPLGKQAKTLLDIGSGVGAIPHELLASGLHRAVVVEASAAYLEASQSEAVRRGHHKRLTYLQGDFVELANALPPADIVTLDRVLCCYPDVEKLVESSIGKAKHVYGLVYPRERLLTRVGVALVNAFFRLRGGAFRTYIHPGNVVDAIVTRHGFHRHSYNRTFLWQVVTYTHNDA
jgi:hypothetical protein